MGLNSMKFSSTQPLLTITEIIIMPIVRICYILDNKYLLKYKNSIYLQFQFEMWRSMAQV